MANFMGRMAEMDRLLSKAIGNGEIGEKDKKLLEGVYTTGAADAFGFLTKELSNIYSDPEITMREAGVRMAKLFTDGLNVLEAGFGSLEARRGRIN